MLPRRLLPSSSGLFRPPRLSRSASSSLPPLPPLSDVKEEFRSFGGGGEIRYTVNPEARVVQMRLCNPGKKNALSGKMMAELHDAADRLEKFQYRGK